MTKEQFDKLDLCHFEYDVNSRCEELCVEARNLLGTNRFDLYAILIYIDHKVRGVKDMSYARNVYKERTRAITGLKLSEPGNDKKNCFVDFLDVLDKMIESFKSGTFDINRTLVPVDKNMVLMDGAHRTACAAYFGEKIKVLRFVDVEIKHMNYVNLQQSLLPVDVCDSMAIEACKWHNDLFLMFLWPKSFTKPQEQAESLELIRNRANVVYEREIKLTYSAIRNLMIQIYGHMDWVGNVDNDFDSTYKKADEVWDECGKCRFILVQARSCDDVLKLKSNVRSIFNMGLSSIHSTDNIRETSLAVNALFNPNSLHFLITAKPTAFKKSYKLSELFKNSLLKNFESVNDYIIDSSMVLAMYGAREANDLDYYTTSSKELRIADNIEEHDDNQKKFYNNAIEDLIIDPSKHFFFNELKYVSLDELIKFKKARFAEYKDSKDRNDIKLIEILLSNKQNAIDIWLIKNRILYKRNKRIVLGRIRIVRNYILKKTQLYDVLKPIWHKMKK